MAFPDDTEFAFTILDDTDDTTVENGRPIYQLLADLGLRTTKTVWALNTPTKEQGPFFAAETLQDAHYLNWVRELAAQGFEIAFHNASMGSAIRDKTEAALALIAAEFPNMPRLHCNHAQNRENLHWGAARYSTPELALAHRLLGTLLGAPKYEGHVPGSPYYWEDIASERLDYVRRFAFLQLDCSLIPPGRPFFDPKKPNIPCWFNTADAANARVFRQTVTPTAIDRIRANHGWCVLSTHLGKGFVQDGRVDAEVRRTLEYLSRQPGWFVPVSELLDHLIRTGGELTLGPISRRRLEYFHVLDRLTARLTNRLAPGEGR